MARGADPGAVEARLLLRDLSEQTGRSEFAAVADDVATTVPAGSETARWASSGAMHLSGPPEGPPALPPAPVASRLAGAAAVLHHLTGVQVDGPALLGQRAALRGLTRRGSTSAGGGSRLVATADGWCAITLSRPADLELVPAWLADGGGDWDAVARTAAATPGGVLAERGQLLGLAVAVVPAPRAPADPQLAARGRRPWVLHPAKGPVRDNTLRVLDLSALWAGPLCARLLALAGNDVTTVDSVGRPDGTRQGDPDLFALLHEGHRERAVDLRTRQGRRELAALIEETDLVISSVRPRALEQLGLSPFEQVLRRPGLTWVAITGYGLTGPWRDRVAYGDDAAAAGGLIAAANPPSFLADAAADPCTGLYAAVAALACARSGGGVVDIALREVARHVARPGDEQLAAQAMASGGEWHVVTPEGSVVVAPPTGRAW